MFILTANQMEHDMETGMIWGFELHKLGSHIANHQCHLQQIFQNMGYHLVRSRFLPT